MGIRERFEHGLDLGYDEAFSNEERNAESDHFPYSSHTDPYVVFLTRNVFDTPAEHTGIKRNVAELSRNILPASPEPHTPKVQPVGADWERSTVSSLSYRSSAGNSGTKTSLPSLPITLETIDERSIRKAMIDRDMKSSSRIRFNDKQLDHLAIALFDDPDGYRQHRWPSIAEKTGQDWKDVKFNVCVCH